MEEQEKIIFRMMSDTIISLKIQIIQLEKMVRDLRLEKLKNG